MLDLIKDNEYEITNNYDEFDWLKVYGDAITKKELDMGALLKGREDVNEDHPRRDDDHWRELGEYACFLHEFARAEYKLGPGPHYNIPAFMAQEDLSGETALIE